MKPIERIQVSRPGILSFHNYQCPSEFQRHLHWLKALSRKLLTPISNSSTRLNPHLAMVQGEVFLSKRRQITMRVPFARFRIIGYAESA
jgi:hypothetical protein